MHNLSKENFFRYFKKGWWIVVISIFLSALLSSLFLRFFGFICYGYSDSPAAFLINFCSAQRFILLSPIIFLAKIQGSLFIGLFILVLIAVFCIVCILSISAGIIREFLMRKIKYKFWRWFLLIGTLILIIEIIFYILTVSFPFTDIMFGSPIL